MPIVEQRTRQILMTHRSPNHTLRHGVDRPDMIVLHYTGMETAEAAVDRLCDPDAEVSSHYVVDPRGNIYALIDEDHRAWHAGQAQWGAVTDVNSHSIGIEIANPGHMLGYPPFPEAQMTSVEYLVATALRRWSIPPERVVGHACIAPGRKIDPGEKFDWARLARQGLAVFETPKPCEERAPDVTEFLRYARIIGYAVPDDTDWTAQVQDVWHAFAMRFLPGRANLPPDASGVAHAGRIAERWPVLDPSQPVA